MFSVMSGQRRQAHKIALEAKELAFQLPEQVWIFRHETLIMLASSMEPSRETIQYLLQALQLAIKNNSAHNEDNCRYNTLSIFGLFGGQGSNFPKQMVCECFCRLNHRHSYAQQIETQDKYLEHPREKIIV